MSTDGRAARDQHDRLTTIAPVNPSRRNLTRRAVLRSLTAAALGSLGSPRAGAGAAPFPSLAAAHANEVLVPAVDGAWWRVAGNPDLGPLAHPRQQPVDFGIWQAADGTWQLWSCIRFTRAPGKTRLFHRWQGDRLTDGDWRPMGIAMQADPRVGETEGGLQAPFVLEAGGTYHMFYGDWEHVCLALSVDGKAFTRRLDDNGKSGLFSNGAGANTRDPMVLRIGDTYHCYTTAHPGLKGAVYCRTSRDLRRWSEARVVAAGGAAGAGPVAAECPFVYRHKEAERYYLFRTQQYGRNARTSVYCSPDPLDFGVNDDRYLVGTLPLAAPEVIEHDDALYLAALTPGLDGIRLSRLRWTRRSPT